MSITKLNILMSYPVKWSEYNVIDNYIQNFYDALGMEEFSESFRYKLTENGLFMMSNKSFEKEWLFFLGASTKRGHHKRYAGGFGEGFKIASLIAYRDFGLSVRMESEDWTIEVTKVVHAIDGTEREFLAYDVGKRPYKEDAVLFLGNAGKEWLEKLEGQISHFFYKTNPYLDECIADMGDCAVYKAQKLKNTNYIYGAVFANFQLRNTIHAPLVICNHVYHPDGDDRDRDSLGTTQLTECIGDVFSLLDPEQSMAVLEQLEKYWAKTTENNISAFDWKQPLTILKNNMVRNPKTVLRFQEKYKEMLVADMEQYVNKNHRTIAREWFRNSEFYGKRRVVRPMFGRLGIMTMDELCKKHNGFTVEAQPDDKEKKYIAVLEKAVRCTLAGLYCLDQFPKCRILLNKEAPVEGYTKLTAGSGMKNAYGLKVQYHADYIYLQRYIFQKDFFAKAFSVYAHELLHQFGGDCSIQFRKALLYMDRLLFEQGEVLDRLSKEWRSIE